MRRCKFAWAALVTIAFASPLLAQDDAAKTFPARPVRVVVGLAAGGGVDVVTRIIAQKLAENLGQSVLVDNRPGASGIIAAELVAKAPADGYTLMMAPSGPMVFNAIMYPKLPYAPLKDFAPISMLVSFPLIAVVNPATPVRSMRELAEYAKANPARGNYAASTAAFQLASELFNLQAGTRLEHIPYKGTNESLTGVMSGDVLLAFADSGPASAALRGAKVRGLAVTAPARMAAFPDIPTMAEAGFPDFDISLWIGLYAPAGTPPAIVRKLEDEVNRALRSADVEQRLATLTVNVLGTSGQELGQTMAAEISRWGAVAKKANVKLNP